MLKNIADSVFSFDVEWIPDPKAGEILHDAAPANAPGEDARAACETLWAAARERAGSKDPDLQPYLKTILCRIVSLAGILRESPPGGEPTLKLVSLPADCSDASKVEEKSILIAFMKSVGRRKPQLVGYNSAQADVPIIVQRAIVNGLPSTKSSDHWS